MTITERRTAAGAKRYRAEVWDNAAGKAVTKTFPTKAAAKSWGLAKEAAIKAGTSGAVAAVTLQAASEQWIGDAEAGVHTNRSGQRYKPSVLRGYEASLRLHVLPTLGRAQLNEIRVDMVQTLVDKMIVAGLAPSSIRNHVVPLRVIFAHARRMRLMYGNPLDGIKLPSGETARDRITTPSEAVRLLAALEQDRALWATAFYTGMRRGELMALDWANVDLMAREIRVERSYDPGAHEFIAPKTKAGLRTVPFPELLLPFLAAENRTQGLVFGPDGAIPFGAKGMGARAQEAWSAAGLAPVTLHECRHTYASLMLASGIDITKVSKWLGHSSITITVDRYGHLVPGSARDDMARFEAYLTKEDA